MMFIGFTGIIGLLGLIGFRVIGFKVFRVPRNTPILRKLIVPLK